MNKKKMIPILTLCAILIVVVIAMLLGARQKPTQSLDALSQTADTEPLTETATTDTETLTEPSESEAETVTEEMETASEEEATEEEVDTEELERVRAIDERNKEIFAKNKELPTVVAYSGVDTSDLIMYDNYEVGGICFFDAQTHEQYFVYADCDLKEAMACIIREPIVSWEVDLEANDHSFTDYKVTTADYTYTLTYDNKEKTVFGLDKDNIASFLILNRADADQYISNFLSDDAPVSSGCGCGCGSDGGCGTESECDNTSTDCMSQ